MILSPRPHSPRCSVAPNPERDLPRPVFDGFQALAQAHGRLQVLQKSQSESIYRIGVPKYRFRSRSFFISIHYGGRVTNLNAPEDLTISFVVVELSA